MSRTRALVAASLSSLALIAAGCGDDEDSGSTSSAATGAAAAPAAEVKSGEVAVAYRDFLIEPEKLTVKAGTKVTWTNFDVTRHNVITKEGAPEKFTSTDFDKGESDSITFTKPGVYPYLCTFHAASMQGEVTVVE